MIIEAVESRWPKVQVAIAYHSVRGHVARLARAVADGVTEVPDAAADPVALDSLTSASWETLDRADAIIFGCPTYMGSPSVVFKAFAEQSLRVWLDDLRWRHKVAAGFTHSQALSGDKLNTLQYFTILAAQHGMVWITLDVYPGVVGQSGILNRLGAWLGAMSQSDRDLSADAAPPDGDLETAHYLGRRVAQVTRALIVGRHVLRTMAERTAP
jgi:NAD(P)H dehydrogenase (quinone)